ncbi:unnamed protein product [Allacma fusca]|uniref:Uncharacterized protein n=1 Tax=Allacma fusca TaxID=39272 RepID=A0A8J2JLE6_9HEXA|nr:unnamed protein product [Allacma fusca]
MPGTTRWIRFLLKVREPKDDLPSSQIGPKDWCGYACLLNGQAVHGPPYEEAVEPWKNCVAEKAGKVYNILIILSPDIKQSPVFQA